MSKFLTPPVWYDKNGNLNEMLAGTSGDSTGIAIGKFASVNGEYGVAFGINAKVGGGYSVAIGESAGTLASAIGGIAIGKGAKANGGDSIAIGEDAKGEVVYGIAIGSGAKANADSTDGIAIGRGATSEQGGIAIGGGAYANVNQIQLGDNNTAYTLNIGNGAGNIMIEEINKIAFRIIPVNDDNSVSVTESGIYLCCLSREDTGGSQSVITNNIAIIYIQPYGTNVGTVLSSQDNVCNYSSSSKKIIAQGSNSIFKCLRIIL